LDHVDGRIVRERRVERRKSFYVRFLQALQPLGHVEFDYPSLPSSLAPADDVVVTDIMNPEPVVFQLRAARSQLQHVRYTM
jgi:hypothetical protein